MTNADMCTSTLPYKASRIPSIIDHYRKAQLSNSTAVYKHEVKVPYGRAARFFLSLDAVEAHSRFKAWPEKDATPPSPSDTSAVYARSSYSNRIIHVR